MRHLRAPPLQVPLLSSRMEGPAARAPLVSIPRPAKAVLTSAVRAAIQTVDLPAVTAPAQHDLLPTATTVEEAIRFAERGMVHGLDEPRETSDAASGSSCGTSRWPRRSGGDDTWPPPLWGWKSFCYPVPGRPSSALRACGGRGCELSR